MSRRGHSPARALRRPFAAAVALGRAGLATVSTAARRPAPAGREARSAQAAPDVSRTRRAGSVVGVVVALGLLIGGLAQVDVSTGVDSFLPANDPAVDALHDYAGAFGSDATVVLLESPGPRSLLEGDQLQSLLRLEGELARLPDVSAVYGPATVLNQVAGRAQDLLAELVGRRDGVRGTARAQAAAAGASPEEADRAADKASAEFDRRYGTLLARGLPSGLPTIRNQQFVENAIYDEQGRPRPQWRFVVPSDRSVALLVRPRQELDQGSTEVLVDRVGDLVDRSGLDTTRTTVSGVPAVVAGLGHQVRQEVPLLGGLAVVGVALCLVATPWASTRRRRLMPVAVTLLATATTMAVYGWIGHPLSLGVVAFLPVLLGVGSYYPIYWAQRAERRVVVTVALATAVSFGALALSPMPFVRDLGLSLALGVLASCGAAALVTRTMRLDEPTEPVEATGPAADGPNRTRLATRVAAVVLAGAVAAAGWASLPAIPLTADFTSFTKGLAVGDDVEHLQRSLGTSGEVDVVLRGPDVTSPEAMAWMSEAEKSIVSRYGDVLRPVTSVPQMMRFLGSEPTPEQISAALRLLPPYLLGAVVGPDATVASLAFGSTQQDAVELEQLRDTVLTGLPAPPSGYRVEVTGLPMLAAHGYDLIDGERYLANGIGVLAAGLVLLIGLGRRRADAGRAVLAAAIATGVGLSLTWLFGVALNPVTVTLGALTAAVGCEFSVMLAEAARSGQIRLRRSVALAAATSGVGYLVLAASGLQAIREFGLLLAVSVLLALGAARLAVWVWPPRPTPQPPGSSPEHEPRSLELTGVGA
ncbi:RND transporter [Pseudonocardia endophytica]|uniref:Membrane transport protein MMPL domain-containing protein n=1 Tax=Pseudonocardia endophytica TaxID=401976 RepID=A0A4R1HUB3_PSEEN|nr:RND transporter [Pseudonocardia endophytica]TCK26277.1 hypothetical protein EV378_2106 [Pseudonocardia endophytica]